MSKYKLAPASAAKFFYDDSQVTSNKLSTGKSLPLCSLTFACLTSDISECSEVLSIHKCNQSPWEWTAEPSEYYQLAPVLWKISPRGSRHQTCWILSLPLCLVILASQRCYKINLCLWNRPYSDEQGKPMMKLILFALAQHSWSVLWILFLANREAWDARLIVSGLLPQQKIITLLPWILSSYYLPSKLECKRFGKSIPQYFSFSKEGTVWIIAVFPG